jgi:uncharacterized membrane protein (DUF373 family)
MMESKLRFWSGEPVKVVEVGIYAALAVLLSATAIWALVGAGRLMWSDITSGVIARGTFAVLDQLLLVLMLVEILHTVRISIRSHTLVTEPFLVVGLIASIRRMLVITLEASDLTKQDRWTHDGEQVFRASMWELGLLGVLILILVFSIVLLRRTQAGQELTTDV